MPSLPEALDPAVLVARTNNALHHNRPIANNNITTHGSDLDWAICVLNGLLLLGVIAWTYITNPRRRIFHYFALSILLVATIYYFVIASDLGGHAVPVEFRGGNILDRTRQVFYARWIGYFINFSLAIFALLLMSGVGWATILFGTGLTMLWAMMFLVGELVRSSYKWGFFVFAVLIYFLLVWQVLGVARSHANRLDSTTHKIFSTLSAYLLGMMILYPIAWALCEGGNRISNDSEQIFYSVIDVLSFGLWSLALLFLTRRLDFDYLRLGFSEYGRVHDHPGDVLHDEKRMRAGRASNVTDGSTAPVAANGHGAAGTTGSVV